MTTDGRMRVKDHGAVVADIPNRALTDEAPVYERPMAEPAYLDGGAAAVARRRWARRRPRRGLPRGCSRRPSIASKRWVYRQYDHMVRTNTLVLPGHGRRRRARQGHAPRAGAVGRRQRRGSSISIRSSVRSSRSPRRRATSPAPAAQPIGATNCLNFGNPERPEIMWQFARAVEGIGAACRALDIPITGGNVSLYNETDGTAVLPTPVLGVVGLIEDATRVVRRAFRSDGRRDRAARRQPRRARRQRVSEGRPRPGARRAAGARSRRARRRCSGCWSRASPSGLIRSAHDCAEGGLAVTLAECCFDTGARR